MHRRLEGKVAIITGGLRGIGRACAEAFLEAGAVTAVLDLDQEASEMVHSLAFLGGEGTQVRYAAVDLTDAAAVSRALAAVTAGLEQVDVLVNCAGGATLPLCPLENLDENDWDYLISLNLKTAYLCTRAVIAGMKAQRSGSIVNLSSQAGRSKSELGSITYTTAKAGILGFTRQLAQECGPFGIRVNAVAPGITLSERVAAKWAKLPQDQQQSMLSAIPLGRLATTAEIANVVLFLASDESSYVTGATIDVNGGRFML